MCSTRLCKDSFAARSVASVLLTLVLLPTLRAEEDLHIVFSTECNSYFDWQTLGMVHSFMTSGQKGRMTRLMACNKEHWPGDVIANGPNIDTHYHPNYAVNPHNQDRYTAYNKPFSVMHFLENYKNLTAKYIAVLDADMIIRKPFTAEMLGVSKGHPVSAHYGYLIGIFKENYMKVKEEVPNVEKAQQVGGFVVHHVEDLRKVAPLWLSYTEKVRTDSGNWANTGDIFNNNGKAGPPWISEMYGYTFACAHAGVDHIVSSNFMLYPGYMPPDEEEGKPWPLVLHYGITYNVNDYAFDKHWFKGGFDYTTCPGKLFQKPMLKSELGEKPNSRDRRRKEVALDAAWGLFNASVWWKETHCNEPVTNVPPYKRYNCKTQSNGVNHCIPMTKDQAAAAARRPPPVEDSCPAQDQNANCCSWAKSGECKTNSGYMADSCPHSCGLCEDEKQPSCLPEKHGLVKSDLLDMQARKERKEWERKKEEVRKEEDTLKVDEEASSDQYPVRLPPQPPPPLPPVISGEDEVQDLLGAAPPDDEGIEEDEVGFLEEERVVGEQELTAQDKSPADEERTIGVGSVRIRTGVLLPTWGIALFGFLGVAGLRRKGKGGKGRGRAAAGKASSSSAIQRLEALEKKTGTGGAPRRSKV